MKEIYWPLNCTRTENRLVNSQTTNLGQGAFASSTPAVRQPLCISSED